MKAPMVAPATNLAAIKNPRLGARAQAREPKAETNAAAAMVRIARRDEERQREQRVPLAAFAECACGD